MGHDIRNVWIDLAGDLATPVIYWQLTALGIALLSAWLLNKLIHRHVKLKAPESWKIGVDGVKRVLFPLASLVFVDIGQMVLTHWEKHTSLLTLASTLLIAMAVIRLVAYALRYVFSPSGWVRTTENVIVGIVWVLVAMHLVGFLPEIIQTLDDVSFTFGKNKISLLLILQAAVMVVVTIIIALSLSRFIENRLMQAEQINMNLRVVMTKLVRILLTLAGVLVGLSAVGFDITLLSVFGGALGVGLGFGLQKIASNYVSGFIILLDESVHIGDVMTVDGHYGVVHQIRSRYLVLRKLDGTEVVIPNETLIASTVINHSLSDRRARVLLPVQVSYEGDLEQAMDIIRQVAVRHPRVLKDPAPDVQIKGFGESGIDLQLSIWIPDPEEGSGNLQSALYLEMWRDFKIHGVVVPYPQREIRMVNAL